MGTILRATDLIALGSECGTSMLETCNRVQAVRSPQRARLVDANAISTSRRIASDRDGLSTCVLRHLS
jgi:hypothetical protein